MYICVCKAIKAKRLKELKEVHGENLRSIQQACGAGTDCGSCLERLQSLLKTGPSSNNPTK